MTAADRQTRRAAARKQRKAEAAAGRAQTPPPDAGGEQPVFFFGFAVPRVKLAVARFFIFGLLAVDAFLQLRHAPRYGAGGFNVGQLGLAHAAPSRVGVGVAYVAMAYLFGATALGVGSRLTVAIGAALYAWVYFASQLDSYQHHYLMVLVLLLAIGVPWFRPRDAARADDVRPVRTWALRVILIQLGILYLWAAIAKFDRSWLDGSALRAALEAGRVHQLIDHTIGFHVTAWLVIATELTLAFAIWIRPLWKIALPLGVAMHAGIAFTNLEIGLFSWLMVALYLLIVPDAWFVAGWREIGLGAGLDRLEQRLAARPALGLVAAGIALALPLVLGLAIDGAVLAALGAGAVILAADAVRRRRRVPRPAAGLAVIAMTGVLAVLAAATAVVPDYYRLWGGASRRLGDLETARRAYRRAIELAPDEPGNHYQLGRLLLAPGDDRAPEAGYAELHRAQALEPGRARALIAEARALAAEGNRDDALAVARRAVAAEPNNREASRLVDALAAGSAQAPAAGPDDDEPAP